MTCCGRASNGGASGRTARVAQVAAALVCMVGAGCTYETQPLSPQPGTLTVALPGRFPTVVSGPGSESAAPSGNGGLPASGQYRGVARVTNNPGGRCRATVPVTNWIVTGNRVRYGKFRGTIGPDGSLQMQAGPEYIRGQFEGGRFTGTVWQPGPRCGYSITVDPV